MIETQLGYLEKINFFSRFNLAIIIFLIWTFSQLVIPIKIIPVGILSSIESYKSILPAIGIIICSIIHIDKIYINRLSYPFILFGFFCALKAFFLFIFISQSFSYLNNPMINIIWVLAIFITIPSILNSIKKIKIFLRYNVLLVVSTLLIGAFLFLYIGFDTSFFFKDGRLNLIYDNPLYLGGILFSLICSSFLLSIISSSIFEKIFLYIVIILSLPLLYLTFSRTFLLGIFILMFAVLMKNTIIDQKKFFTFSLFASFIALFLSSFFLFQFAVGKNISLNDINSFSSGRIEVWSMAITDDIDGINVLWGGDGKSEKIGINTGIGAYDEQGLLVKAEKTFNRYAVDNTYIEILINNGIIGLFIFLWGVIKIIKNSFLHKISNSKDTKFLSRINSIVAAMFLSISVTAFFYSHIPSIGNIINSIMLPSVISLIFLLRNKRIYFGQRS